MSRKPHPLLTGLGIAAGLSALYALVIRPKVVQRWGASEEELAETFPGDELIPNPRLSSTRAVTIQAPPDQVWPWLAQIGYQRAGWYSYDYLEELAGVANFVDGHTSAWRIIPELQTLRAGDWIYTHPDGGFIVDRVEPGCLLVLRTRINPLNGKTVDIDQTMEGDSYDCSWAFYLKEIQPGTTRLVARFRTDYPTKPWMQVASLIGLEPVVFLMEQKMLRGIKERAELCLATPAMTIEDA